MGKQEKKKYIQKHFSKKCVIILHDLAQQRSHEDSKKSSIRCTCTSCNVVFDNIDAIKTHIHKPFVCKFFCFVCSKNFNTKGGLLVHIMQHLMDNQAESYSIMHVCNVCCDGFASAECLEQHINIHHAQVNCSLSLVKEEASDMYSDLISEIKTEEPVLSEPQESFEPPTISLPETTALPAVNQVDIDPASTQQLVPWLAPILPECPPFFIYGSHLFIRASNDLNDTKPSEASAEQNKKEPPCNSENENKTKKRKKASATKPHQQRKTRNKNKKLMVNDEPIPVMSNAPSETPQTVEQQTSSQTSPIKFKLVPDYDKKEFKLVRDNHPEPPLKIPIPRLKCNTKKGHTGKSNNSPDLLVKEHTPLEIEQSNNPDSDVEEVPAPGQSECIVIGSSDSDASSEEDKAVVKSEEQPLLGRI